MKTQNKNKFLLKKTQFCYFGFSLAVLMLLPIVTAAQFNLPNISDIKPTVSLSADPSTPLPNSTVIVTANLSGITGGGSFNYSWFLNGARQNNASGLSKNTLSFKSGAIGTVYRINVSVQTPNSELSDTLNLTVSDVDLTWVADSQAPANYRAKLMPTQNSFVIISALPFIYAPGTITRMSSNNLVYNWTVNDKLDPENSGVGRSSYVLRASNFFGNPYQVRLEIKTVSGAVSLNKFLTIPIARPQILLYVYDPESGQPLGIALKSLTTKPMNLSLIAQPYFSTVTSNNFKWQWSVNNAAVGGETEKPWLATLNLANFGQLSAQIKVVATNPNNDLESGQSTIDLEVK